VRIAVYCQHVLGMGHLFRTLEILEALSGHERLLLLGGPDVPVGLPRDVTLVRLPALSMDAEFAGLSLEGEALAAVKETRRALLGKALAAFSPDVFFVEFYPFGRKAFEFELVPALEALRRDRPGACRVVCGVRDILVEKKDQAGYEARVLDRLGRFFDAVCVHGDPSLMPLGATFARAAEIPVPVAYTGYVAAAPGAGCTRAAVRRRLGVGQGRRLLVASAGGGKVGSEALAATLAACAADAGLADVAVRVFAGPYCPQEAYAALEDAASRLPDAVVTRFADHFPDIVGCADLSLSLAGYNTVMTLLASGARGLVLPFDQNREQRLRATRLAARGLLGVLEPEELAPARLAGRITAALAAPPPSKAAVDLDGARKTAALLTSRAF
jgi:predicted glycosyltransferase